MTANAFGGLWTKEKLDVLRDYLGFYCKALSGQKFDLVYIDAFAGTGRCGIRDRAGERQHAGQGNCRQPCEGRRPRGAMSPKNQPFGNGMRNHQIPSR